MQIAARMMLSARERARFRIAAWAACTPLLSAVCTVMIAAACQPVESDDEQVPVAEAPERWAIGADLDDDLSGDLRPEALALIEARNHGDDGLDQIAAAWQPPTTIRVWRRGLDHSTASCSGRVDVIAFET